MKAQPSSFVGLLDQEIANAYVRCLRKKRIERIRLGLITIVIAVASFTLGWLLAA